LRNKSLHHFDLCLSFQHKILRNVNYRSYITKPIQLVVCICHVAHRISGLDTTESLSCFPGDRDPI